MAIAQKPLLMDGLSNIEKANLAQMALMPGYLVLEKLMEAACDESRIAINDVNPEDPGYVDVLKARQQYSRAINKFSVLVLRSIKWHTDSVAVEDQKQELEALERIESQD